MVTMRIFLMGLLLVLGVGLMACGGGASKELEQGVQVIQHMLRPSQLKRSAFYVAYPDGKPSDFVSYLFSEMGSAEWPDSQAMAERDPILYDQAHATNTPLIPKGVAFHPLQVNLEEKNQVVVKFDNARGKVIIEAYADPARSPVIVKEKNLMKVTPEPTVELFYRNNLEMGMSPKSF